MTFPHTSKIVLLAALCLISQDVGAFSFSQPAARTVSSSGSSVGAAVQAGSRRKSNALLELNAVSVAGTGIEIQKDVKNLLRQNRRVVDSLASVADSDDENNEITRLRFAMAFDTEREAKEAYQSAIEYRSKGRGKAIVDAAKEAYEAAIIGGGWDNEVVRKAAPNASKINKYISQKNIVTLSTSSGDLVYAIRASSIDDKKMMDDVTVEQMSGFFMYVKEVHNLVANERTKRTGRLCEVIFANDITGVRKAPDSRFSKALSSSSSQYAKLYPSLAGPTMILNLPFILQAFVALFKPLFPKAVQEKLKFIRAPVLGSLKDLTPLVSDKAKKNAFLRETEELARK